MCQILLINLWLRCLQQFCCGNRIVFFLDVTPQYSCPKLHHVRPLDAQLFLFLYSLPIAGLEPLSKEVNTYVVQTTPK